jgi:tetratricopeptide (TPR) repeat protein
MHTAAARLFVDRARATNPDFAVNSVNAPAIGEICRRLDGLPLGIELAAARTKFMSPQAMVARLGSRLDLLASTDRERPSRHQTLRQALAWSYDLLDTDQRSVFRRAGVFVNGFSVEAMEAVCTASGGDTPRVLDSIFLLADHSLIARRDAQDGEPRFYLLETMREYALELLQRSGEEDEVRGAHAQYFAQMTAQSANALTGNDQAYWFRRLDVDHDNIRAALHWLSGHNEPESALRIAVSIWRFWTARGCQREGRAWMERLLDQAVYASPELRADALNGCGTLAHGSGDLTGARTFLQQALQLYRENQNTYGIGMALNNLAWVATEMGEYEEASIQAEEALQMQQGIRDIRGMAVALNNLGWIANYRAEFQAARSFHQRSIALRREAGDYRGLAFGLTNLAWVEQRAGCYEKARTLSEEALDVLQDVRDEVLRAWARQQRGAIAYEAGRIDEALEDIASALPVWNSVGNSSGHAFGVFYQTLALIHAGDVNQAAAVMGRAAADPDSMTHRWGAAVLLLASSHLAFAKGDRAEAIVNVIKAIFCFSSFGDRRSLADAYEWLACVVWDDDPSEAREALRIAGDLRRQIGVPPPPCSRAALEQVLVATAN